MAQQNNTAAGSGTEQYLIAHIGHTTRETEHICWWKPDSRGYTYCIDKAGRYGAAEASDICRHGGCIAVKPADAQKLARSTPYYRRYNGTLNKLYDGDQHTVVPNESQAWKVLMNARLHVGKTERPTPIGAKARAIYLTEGGAA